MKQTSNANGPTRIVVVSKFPAYVMSTLQGHEMFETPTSHSGIRHHILNTMTEKRLHLRVTAGPSYSSSTHHLLPVNTPTPLHISSSHISASIAVRIQNYRGLPSTSPSTSSYFSEPHHKTDLYSIAFSFTLKDEDIPGTDLQFGNDFEKPIRDKLPTGFGTAYRLLRWAIDPGLDGDVYSEHPYLYGPLLSSINVLRVGEKSTGALDQEAAQAEKQKDEVITEGADGEEAEEIRHRLNIPDDGAKRMKHFLNKAHKEAFVFEKGRQYSCDFFNGYLDFNGMAIPKTSRRNHPAMIKTDKGMISNRSGTQASWRHDEVGGLLGWTAVAICA